MEPLRFSNDASFLHYLQTINPTCDYAPYDFDWRTANDEARCLVDRFNQELGCKVGFDGGMSIQDATFFADIGLPCGILRFSNYDHLVTLCADNTPDPGLLARIVSILEEAGYTFVPFHFFGKSFSSLDRHNGDLFTQLFDYV